MLIRSIIAQRYREQADRLRANADNVHDLTMRNELRDLARKHEALAIRVERMFGHLRKPTQAISLPIRPIIHRDKSLRSS
jgi:hypothetical protein